MRDLIDFFDNNTRSITNMMKYDDTNVVGHHNKVNCDRLISNSTIVGKIYYAIDIPN